MGTIVVGSTEFSAHVARAVTEVSEFQAIVTSNEGGPTELHTIARESGATIVRTDNINSREVRDTLEKLSPSVGVCAGWTDILGEQILEVPEFGFVGLHASFLPRGRGGAPVNWRLINDRETVGLSLFRFTPEVDDGDIFEQRTVEIESRDDIQTVYDKVSTTAKRMIRDELPAIERGEAVATPQDRTEATYRPNRRPSDGIIDWTWSATKLEHWVRALKRPYPGAFSFLDGRRLVVWKASSLERKVTATPGEVLEVNGGRGVLVATGDGVLRLERIQLGEEPPVWADRVPSDDSLTPGVRIGRPDDYPDWTYTGIRGSETPTVFDTNVSLDETASVDLVACSQPDPVTFEVHVDVDGETRSRDQLLADGWTDTSLEVEFGEPGIKNMTVEFRQDGSPVDRRFLKWFVHA